MTIAINPGTGPVTDADESLAEENIKKLIEDVELPHVHYKRMPEQDWSDGRFCFWLARGNLGASVDMPGVPLEKVRYLGEEGQDIFDYPRLYVCGASWVWPYAVSTVRDFLTPGGSHMKLSAEDASAIKGLSAHIDTMDTVVDGDRRIEVVAWDDGLVGHACIEVYSFNATLTNLFVVPGRRREGIGSAIVQAAEEAIGHDRMLELYVDQANKAAVDLYRSLGWVEGRVDDKGRIWFAYA